MNRITVPSGLSHLQSPSLPTAGPQFLGASPSRPDSSRACVCTSTQRMGRQRGAGPRQRLQAQPRFPLPGNLPQSTAVLCEFMQVITTSHACCPGLLPTASSLARCQHTNAHFSPLTVFDTYFIELFTLCSQHPLAHKTNHVLEACAVVSQWL